MNQGKTATQQERVTSIILFYLLCEVPRRCLMRVWTLPLTQSHSPHAADPEEREKKGQAETKVKQILCEIVNILNEGQKRLTHSGHKDIHGVSILFPCTLLHH